MRLRSRAAALGLALTVGVLAPAGPAAAADPDPVRLQQTVPAVKQLLDKAGTKTRPMTEFTPPSPAEIVAGELKGRPPASATSEGLPPRAHDAADCKTAGPFAEPRFAGFDTQVTKMMSDWGIMSGSVAVANECGVLYDQGYGRLGPWWLRNAPAGDIFDFGPQTPDDALFRIASVTKPITAAAIQDLADRKLLNKGDRAFCVPGGPKNCVLTLPLPAKFDKRIGDITVQHLVGHRGGFDRGVTTDYLFRAWEVHQARKLNAPPTARDFATYMLGLGLDFAPGTASKYSNLGYLMLGLIIEKVSGLSFRDYAYQRVLAPLGIASGDVVLSRTKRAFRSTREPAYLCLETPFGANKPVSTFPGEAGKPRCWADGGYVLEAMAAHGGLSMSARAVATFFAHWWNFGSRRTQATYWNFPEGTKVGYGHNGLLAEVTTVAIRCLNGLNVALLTNQHAWGTFDYAAAESRLCKAASDFLAQGPYYSTIWVKDGKPWRSYHGTPAANYQALVDRNKKDGYRLVDVNGHRTGGVTTYQSTWVKDGSAAFAATHGHTFAQFTTTFNEYVKAGYRLERISGWTDAGGPRYASAWVPNPKKTAWVSHIRMSHAEYQKKFDEYHGKGYRLISVDGYAIGNAASYAAVWVKNSGTAYRAIHGATQAGFQAFFDKAVKDGYRLTDKDVFTVGPNVVFAGVATKDGGPAFKSFSHWNFYTFQPKWTQQKAAGFRPVTVSAYR